MPFLIAIDGPAGAGKSTVARQVALRLRLTYIDTGAMYRAVALRATQAEIDLRDTARLVALSQHTHIQLSPLTPEGKQSVLVDGQDETLTIRTPEVSQATSKISAVAEVRKIVVEQQRRVAQESERGVVLEGRDIGTVVFPHAQAKIFLTASPGERAKRRFEELKQRGVESDFNTVLREQEERDKRDSERETAPLKPAPDSRILLTDGLTIPEVVEQIVTYCYERGFPPQVEPTR